MLLLHLFRDFLTLLKYSPNPVVPLKGTLTLQEQVGKETFDFDDVQAGLGEEVSNSNFCYGLSLLNSREPFRRIIDDGKGPYQLQR